VYECQNARTIVPYSILPQDLYPLHLTEVTREDTYSYYGASPQVDFIKEAAAFFAENSDAHLTEAENTLYHFFETCKIDYLLAKASNFSPRIAVWFDLRLTLPKEDFTLMPRWHRDGRMYTADNECDVNSKYATTLLGNPTRILRENDLLRKAMKEYGNGTNFREAKAKALMLEPLLELNIVFGSDDEIAHMCETRNQEYRS